MNELFASKLAKPELSLLVLYRRSDRWWSFENDSLRLLLVMPTGAHLDWLRWLFPVTWNYGRKVGR